VVGVVSLYCKLSVASVIMSKMDEAKKIYFVYAQLIRVRHGGIGGARPCALGACTAASCVTTAA
jgi:hypothetical protein